MKKKLIPTIFSLAFAGTLLLSSSATTHAENDGIRTFVDRMYTTVLGREAEDEGLEWWIETLERGTTDGANLVNSFLLSDEFESKNCTNSEYVSILYSAILNRDTDKAGADYWVGCLESGMPKEEVLSGFVNSLEFYNLCGEYGILRGAMTDEGTAIPSGLSQFTERLYTKILGRSSEEEGLEWWTKSLAGNTCTPKDAAKNFFLSEEYLAKNVSNREFVENLYEVFMDRASDEDGYSFWLGALEGGTERETVIADFANCDEFRRIADGFGVHIHGYAVTSKTEPDCIHSGVTVYECSCGDSYTVETPPTGVHTESGHIIRKNYLGKTNLSEDGCCLVEHYSVTYGCCTLGCDYHWVANRDKEAHGGGHDIRGYSATCTTEGLSTGWTCSCGKKIREQEILPALGHNYKIRQTENYNEDWTEVEYIELCNRCNLVFRTWWEKLE